MNFENYARTLLCKVQLYTGNETEVTLHEVTKNNGVKLTGIMAKRKGTDAFPTLYINDYYTPDVTGEDIEYIAMKLAQVLKNAELGSQFDFDAFMTFEKAQASLGVKLINAESNKELLLTVPHRRFNNLAMVCIYRMKGNEKSGDGVITIGNDQLKAWEMTEEELMDKALENSKLILPYKIWRISDILREMSGKDIEEEVEVPMYVLSNECKQLGAATMLYKEALEEASELLCGDMYILPSSIHELILLPAENTEKAKSLLEMVSEINHTQVEETDVLADSVYYYDSVKKEVRWVC